MELSIKRVSEGATFMVDFKKIVVEKCHYVNAFEERVEKTSILSNATATILRGTNNGTIFIQVFDKNLHIEYPLSQFKVTTAYYHKNERTETSQTSVVRGDEIIEEMPIARVGIDAGKINLFMISKQQGRIIAFLIINPSGIDDYYYRIMFDEE